MKIKIDFVTNSSSTAFIIHNKTNEKKELVDFAIENIGLLDEFREIFGYKDDERYRPASFLESVFLNNFTFEPNEAKRCVFGDEQDTIVGHVYDYILRDGGDSKSFSWYLKEYLR